jgi:hypothetical protein
MVAGKLGPNRCEKQQVLQTTFTNVYQRLPMFTNMMLV